MICEAKLPLSMSKCSLSEGCKIYGAHFALGNHSHDRKVVLGQDISECALSRFRNGRQQLSRP